MRSASAPARLAGGRVGVAASSTTRRGPTVGEVRAADLHRRGHARLVVKTPAAATGAPSVVATIARSGAPDLDADARPPASNPAAAVTLTA